MTSIVQDNKTETDQQLPPPPAYSISVVPTVATSTIAEDRTQPPFVYKYEVCDDTCYLTYDGTTTTFVSPVLNFKVDIKTKQVEIELKDPQQVATYFNQGPDSKLTWLTAEPEVEEYFVDVRHHDLLPERISVYKEKPTNCNQSIKDSVHNNDCVYILLIERNSKQQITSLTQKVRVKKCSKDRADDECWRDIEAYYQSLLSEHLLKLHYGLT